VAAPGRFARVSIALTSPAALVRVGGDVDRDVVADLRGALRDALAVRTFAVVDLTTAGAIVPAGLDTLARARNAAWRKAGDLLLAAPSPVLRRILRQHSAFRTFDTVPQAVTAAWTKARPTE
jgi:anti-anti-sigma regulatory factor